MGMLQACVLNSSSRTFWVAEVAVAIGVSLGVVGGWAVVAGRGGGEELEAADGRAATIPQLVSGEAPLMGRG